MDPRANASREDRIAQFEFLKSIRDKADETHDAIRHMRSVKSQVFRSPRAPGRGRSTLPSSEEAHALDSLMTAVDGGSPPPNQTQKQPGHAKLSHSRLNNKLAHVASLAEHGGVCDLLSKMVGVRDEVTALIDAELAKWHTLRDERLPAFNALIRDSLRLI